MDEETSHIDVRAVHVSDAFALSKLDYDFETDRINSHFYPPGTMAHEVAISMGKRLSTLSDA